jgi:ABC-type iron transport system FetAB ATPase subunit
MASLGLSRVANSLVGDIKRRGVSGGEKKRVNIGLELMALPSVLFLDEPTSGLVSHKFVGLSSRCFAVLTQMWVSLFNIIFAGLQFSSSRYAVTKTLG